MLATLTRLSLFAVIRSKEVVNALSRIHILEIYELDSREITVDRVTDSATQEKKKVRLGTKSLILLSFLEVQVLHRGSQISLTLVRM